MPFTVSHAAAVLPFRKLNLIWSAFIIGSMAPDFPYLIGSTEYRDLGHDFPGILFFTIPVSLAALWLFHNVIKRPIVGLLPVAMQQRLRGQIGEFKFTGASRFLAILGNVLLGIASHLLWDAFTHSETFPWYHIAWLRGLVRMPILGVVPMPSALQYYSTVAGLLALFLWICLWYRNTASIAEGMPEYRPESRFPLAIAIFAIAAVAGILRAEAMFGTHIAPENADHFFLVCAVTCMAVMFWQLLLYCVLVSSHQMWTIT
jgi:uncharacterized integral membrane protein